MTNFEIANTLKSMVILYDTREQQTDKLKRRLEDTQLPHEREKLDFGDYSCKCTLPSGEIYSLKNSVVVERKMNLDELCLCFCKERERFKKEFIRAFNSGAKTYLLIECADWEKAFNGKYRSKLNPDSLIASILAWSIRFGVQIVFCKPETTGKLMRKIFYYELKERLEKGDLDAQ